MAVRSAMAWCGALPTLASAMTCLAGSFLMYLWFYLKQAVAKFSLSWVSAKPLCLSHCIWVARISSGPSVHRYSLPLLVYQRCFPVCFEASNVCGVPWDFVTDLAYFF